MSINYRYLKNLRDHKAQAAASLCTIKKQKPKFANKAQYRKWCSDPKTDHVFYSLAEGRAPAKRISNDNPVNKVSGIVADYDAGVNVNWGTIKTDLEVRFKDHPPTYYTETESGYMRLVWEFESTLPIAPETYTSFMTELAKKLRIPSSFGGFDETSLKAGQYFELGKNWTKLGDPLEESYLHSVLAKTISSKPPQSGDTNIPIDVVAKEIEDRFPNRWKGPFEVGSRGPLVWIDDGIDRDGCQVVEDGVVCYSDRAGKGFMSWADIFGQSFVKDYEDRKLTSLLDEYWFNGRSFFKLLHDNAVAIPKEQLILELRQAGFSPRLKKGHTISEVESAILTVSNHNRIDEIAPVVFSADRIVSYNGSRILNCSNLQIVQPEANGKPQNWPFIHGWLKQLFVDSSNVPSLDYLYAWLKRFYEAVYFKKNLQGQAMVLVGPTGRGKSLLSNRIISGLVGGFSDASDYLSGQTKFNKDLGRVASWVIDDTTSAASFQDQRRATELLKRAVANPRIEYQAKYADALSVPWSGRVTLSLNMDANSLSVIPSLDSSNRDKIMAMLVREDATDNFPANHVLETTINEELPFFAKFLLDYVPPKEVRDTGRFGVKSYIDPAIADAAYDNSSRSAIAELVEFFSKRCREADPSTMQWSGTLTEFQVMLHDFNNGRSVGMSNNLEFVRRGMATLEEASRVNRTIRPVTSSGKGGGKLWKINLSDSYDIGATP
jgi:hypothetical protein